MTTREHPAWEAVTAPPASTSTALVPLRADRAPAPPAPRPPGPPRNVHRVFYGMGYSALGFFILGTFLQPRIGPAAAGFFILGAMFLGLGGVGVLGHVAYKPSVAKLRKGLGAVAAVVLTAAAIRPIDRIAQEVHADTHIAAAQALVDDLARDGRVRVIGVPSAEWVTLNGFHGKLDGSYASTSAPVDTSAFGAPVLPLYEVLRRDGISRLELVRMMNRLQAAGVSEMVYKAGVVTVRMETGADLLYVRPGHVLPTGTVLAGQHTRPLGGGWYLLAGRRWRD